MNILDATKKLLNFLASKMLWQVFLLTVVVSVGSVFGAYKFYFEKKIEKASGQSVEDVTELKENYAKLVEQVEKIDRSLENITTKGQAIIDKVDFLADLVKEVLK